MLSAGECCCAASFVGCKEARLNLFFIIKQQRKFKMLGIFPHCNGDVKICIVAFEHKRYVNIGFAHIIISKPRMLDKKKPSSGNGKETTPDIFQFMLKFASWKYKKGYGLGCDHWKVGNLSWASATQVLNRFEEKEKKNSKTVSISCKYKNTRKFYREHLFWIRHWHRLTLLV